MAILPFAFVLLSGFLMPSNASATEPHGSAVSLQPDRRIEIPVTLVIEGASRPAPRVMKEAREQASLIYDSIGVALAWTDEREMSRQTDPRHLVVALLSDSRTDRFLKDRELPLSVLGVAPPQTGRVYLFWDRIARRAAVDDVRPQIVLGRVMAHEIGHHLLPLKGHSESGLMRPSLNYTVREPPRFTAAQAESIRRLLSDASLGD